MRGFLFLGMFYRKKRSKTIVLQIEDFQVEVTFKAIKNLYLKVSRRTGVIRVSAPNSTAQKNIERFILSRKQWIIKHLSNPVQSEQFKYEEGEMHRILGAQVPLNIDYVNKNTNAHYHNDAISLLVKPSYDAEKKEEVLDRLYRRMLKELVRVQIEKWEPVMGVKVNEFGIRKMKTRWGTCNIRDRRIWLNLHMAKERPEVIEMVVVHEMVHLLERLHNKRFYSFMDQFLPEWRQLSKELDGRVC